MNDDDLRLLRSAGSEAELAAGQFLIERGQHASGVYVILEGTVRVEAPEGTRELGPGACIGERGVLAADGRRTARVKAVTDVRVLAVTRNDFERLCDENPVFAERVAGSVG